MSISKDVHSDDSAHSYNEAPVASKLAEHDVVAPNFAVPVDLEHKSKVLKIWSFNAPHHLSFQLNWLAFFISFMSAYAAAPLVPLIRDTLNLQQHQANIAGVVTTAGTVFVRIAMGQSCDYFGPRYSYAFLLIGTSVFVFCMSMTANATGYIIIRMLIGCVLASFVTCQFWTSMMFSPSIVGIANAVAGGWGNAGGGVTQIIMPQIAVGIEDVQPKMMAWRWAFFVPAALQVIIAFAILFFTQDLPDGNYHTLQRSGKKQKARLGKEALNVFLDYRTWGLAACYAYSFGVELTLDNALAPYFEQNFDFGIEKAANLAAIFGLCNFFARPLGGLASDVTGRYWGMRGRIWTLFIVMFLGGVGVMTLGYVHESLTSTLVMTVFAAVFLEATCGAVYGVVPFVSRRSTGVVCGLVSAGGAVGGVLNQAIFFLTTPVWGAYTIQKYNSMKYMGFAVIGVSLLGVAPIYFPMWGGLFCGPKKGVTEEDYYYSEYTEEERQRGAHLASSAFAVESRSMRGMKRLKLTVDAHGPTPATFNSPGFVVKEQA